jgi:hypothetical protein
MSVEITKLPSGLTVVTDSMEHLQTAALGVWTGVGGRDEKSDEHGMSHLLEHMAFKGTTRRTAQQIAEEIEAVGGDLNAATSNETPPIMRACSRPMLRSDSMCCRTFSPIHPSMQRSWSARKA